VLTRDAIYEAFYDDALTRGFLHSHSYTGNALACRAALATLDIFERENVIEANRGRAAKIRQAGRVIAQHPKVRHYRETGMITAFEIDTGRPDFARWFFEQALVRELLLRPIGKTVYFMPPYVIADDEIALLAQRTLEIVAQA
jgi:adenosylmethionine-8-amino-7-oxononanoate aminotransferase